MICANINIIWHRAQNKNADVQYSIASIVPQFFLTKQYEQ